MKDSGPLVGGEGYMKNSSIPDIPILDVRIWERQKQMGAEYNRLVTRGELQRS